MTTPDTSLRSERRFVTCLFADVTGSTHLAETMDPEDWTDIMNRAFTAMIGPVHEYGGHVARLMGDGLLAMFGAPTAHEDDPERAVLAGLGIIRAIGPLRNELADDGLDFNVRVGINSGVTVVGMVGPAGAAEYTAMGDAVNVAARMEQTATPGTVQVSQATYRHVARAVEADAIGAVSVKGKAEPVQSYRVRRRRSREEREQLMAPLLGRDVELAELRGRLDRLRAGRGHVVVITGIPGIGKSRLVSALRTENDESDDPVPWWQAGGMSYDHTRPLSAVVNRTRQLYGIEPGDSRDEIRQAIESVHGDEFPGELLDKIVEAIVRGFSARHAGRDDEMLSGETFRMISQAFVGGIRASAAASPSVIVFEDLQWLDAASASLVGQVLALADELPVLFLALLRPQEDSPGWAVVGEVEAKLADRITTIELGGLEETAARDLALAELGVDWMPREIERQLFATAQGNPLFTIELAHALRRHGAIAEVDGNPKWDRSYRLEDGQLTPTLRSLITSRVDRLAPDARALLQTASVVGHGFPVALLSTVVDERVADVDALLQSLLDGGLLREASQYPERRVAFGNEMLRQVAYESILKRDRRQLHARVAQAMHDGDGSPDPHALAHHYRRAGDERAYIHSVQAGEEAVRLASYADAATNFSYARELLPLAPDDPEELLRITTMLGRAYELSGRHSVALREYERLEKEAIEYELPDIELAALVHQAVTKATFNDQFDPVGGRIVAERARSLAVKLGDNETLAHVEWALMLLSMFGSRDYDAAIEHGTTGLNLAREYGTERNLAYLVHDLGRANMLAGNLEDGHDLVLEARRHWESMNEPSMVADTWAMDSDYRITIGDLEGARRAADEVTRIGVELESDWLLAIAQGNLVTIDIEQGRYATARGRFEDAVDLARRAGMSELLIQYSAYAALLRGLAGDPEGGLAALDTWDGPPVVAAAESRAGLHMIMGDLEAAVMALGGADSDGVTPAPMGLQDFYAALALEVEARGGDAHDALDRAMELDAAVERAGRRLARVDVRYVIGCARLSLDEVESAVEVFTEAAAEARAIGSKRNLWRVLAALATGLERLGRSREAAGALAAARQTIGEIAEGFPDAVAQAQFLALPDIAAVIDPG